MNATEAHQAQLFEITQRKNFRWVLSIAGDATGLRSVNHVCAADD